MKGVIVMSDYDQMKHIAERWRAPTSMLVDSTSLVRRHLAGGKIVEKKNEIIVYEESDMRDDATFASALSTARNRVHIVTGGSGTGKTSAALLMSALPVKKGGTPKSVTILLLAKMMEFCQKANDANETSQRDERNVLTTIAVLKGVFEALSLRTSIDKDSDFSEKVTNLLRKLKIHGSKASAATGPEIRQDIDNIFRDYFVGLRLEEAHEPLKVTIVIDEIGPYQHFLFGLTSVWKSDLRETLAAFLKVDEVDIHLVVAGTGAENFELAPCGSMPKTYAVYSMQSNDDIFRALLHYVCDSSNALNLFTQRNPILAQTSNKTSLQHYIAQFAGMVREKLYNKDQHQPRIVDEVTYRFHQLVRNARCAALAIEAIIAVTFKTEVFSKSQSITRVMLPVVCALVVSEFISLNGLSDKDPELVLQHLSDAIKIVLDRRSHVDEDTWKELATNCGLLTDSSFYVAKVDAARHTVIRKADANGLTLVYFSHLPRFCLSTPAVPLFLAMTNPLQSDSIFRSHSKGDSRVFEDVVADFFMTCAFLDRKTASSSSSLRDSSSSKQVVDLTTTPRKIFDLFKSTATFSVSEFTVYRATHELPFKIEPAPTNTNDKKGRALFEASKAACKSLGSRQAEFLEVKAGKAIAVFLNGENASSADVVVLAPNSAMLVQVKYIDSDLDQGIVEGEFDKMEHPDVLQMIADCCVADSATEFVLHSVFLTLHPDSFPQGENPHKTWNDMLNGLSLSPDRKGQNRLKGKEVTVKNGDIPVSIKRYIAYAVNSPNAGNNGNVDGLVGNLHPLMTMPFREMIAAKPSKKGNEGTSSPGSSVEVTFCNISTSVNKKS